MRVIRLLVVSLVALLALAGCASPGGAAPVTVELAVPAEGLGETRQQDIALGAPITLRITTAFDDEVHLHGYELTVTTVAGEPVDMVFDATMAGSYEVESHVTDEVYLKLVVR
ncbi:MAG TPA: hypothetical protein PKE40_15170 [Arachnia sp.]|nr:hypothetical protein [Arachnia sp.]HMT87682.1 hypothetical protein [Arachnia sp.]